MEYTTILFNSNYGTDGLNPSDELCDKYREKYGKEFNFDRDDKLMVELIRETNDYSIGVSYFDKKYEGCHTISEYDGLEKVTIDINKYRIKLIKEIPDDEFNKEKVMEILNMNIPRPKIYISLSSFLKSKNENENNKN